MNHKKILSVILPPVVILALGALIMLIIVQSRQDSEALAHANKIADMLDASVGPDGRYIRLSPTEPDYWGNQYKVIYSGEGANPNIEHITVISAGRDGEFGTANDTFVTRHNFITRNVGRELSNGVVRGIIDGIKESFREE